MSKFTIEIEFPDKILGLSEWEPIAFRPPKKGEHYAHFNDIAGFITLAVDGCVETPRLIVKKKWQWPMWLNCEKIVKDITGVWIMYAGDSKLGLVRFYKDSPPVEFGSQVTYYNPNWQK